jgi:hypothetical protein
VTSNENAPSELTDAEWLLLVFRSREPLGVLKPKSSGLLVLLGSKSRGLLERMAVPSSKITTSGLEGTTAPDSLYEVDENM